MLLVNDDEPKIVNGCKHGRSSTDDHLRISPANPPPLIKPFPGTEPGMNHRRSAAESSAEPADHLGCQGDFRHQNHGTFSLPQGFSYQADKHFRFSAAGYAVKQILSLAPLQIRQHHIQHFLLLIGKHRVIRHLFFPVAAGAAKGFLPKEAYISLFRQGIQGRLWIPNQHSQLPHCVGFAVLQQGQQGAAFLGSPLFFHGLGQLLFILQGALRHGAGALFHPAATHFRRHHQPKGLCQGAVGIFRHALG